MIRIALRPMTLALASVLVACGSSVDVRDQPGDPGSTRSGSGEAEEVAGLAGELRYSSLGGDGNFFLTLQSDGSALAQVNRAEPYEFIVEEPRLQRVEELVRRADLGNQPETIRSERELDGAGQLIFEYDGHRVDGIGPDIPDEVFELSIELRSIVADNRPEGQ